MRARHWFREVCQKPPLLPQRVMPSPSITIYMSVFWISKVSLLLLHIYDRATNNMFCLKSQRFEISDKSIVFRTYLLFILSGSLSGSIIGITSKVSSKGAVLTAPVLLYSSREGSKATVRGGTPGVVINGFEPLARLTTT